MHKRHDIVFSVINANSDLKWFFNYYMAHNLSLTAPYHNLNHTLNMMQLVIDIVRKSKDNSFGFVLDEQDLFILLLCALFHDFNHSAGRFSDKINVDNAKQGLKDAIELRYGTGGDAGSLFSTCASIIDATQYPYIIDDESLTLKQRIIRELDVLVVMFDDFITQCVMGLAEEMKWQDFLKCFSEYTKFLLESFNKMKLQYSLDLFEENKDNFLTKIDLFAKLLI